MLVLLLLVGKYLYSQELRGVMYFLLACITLLAVMNFFVIKAILKISRSPIQQLLDVLNGISKTNELHTRASLQDDPQVNQLVESFNDMLESVENSQMELEIMYRELVLKSTEAENSAAELEDKNKVIKEMISGAAHDLRQPLQAMTIFLETLRVKNRDANLSSLLDKLDQSMNNLKEMFADILDVSKVTAVTSGDELSPVNLHDHFSDLCVEFQALAERKGIEFRIRVVRSAVWGRASIIERIIRNLISNAINYTESGGVLVAERRLNEGIAIDVYDTGCGISKDKQEGIFNKFEQVGEDNESRASGYGLGLAIVKQLAEMMGYEIGLYSVPGRGSRFRLFIPEKFRYQENDTSYVDRTALSAEDAINDSKLDDSFLHVVEQLEKTNVLLIDDDDDVRSSMRLLLESWDMGVVDFRSISEMDEYFNSGDFIDPDIVISDYQLQGGDTGDSAISEARLSLGINVPGVIVTGNQNDHIHKEIVDKGFEYLLKPVEPQSLKKLIHKYVN